jgi:carboxyl-terminal processing protease
VIGTLKPGEAKSAVLTLEVKKGGSEEKVPLRVMVADEKLDVWSSERLEVPVRAEGAPRVAAAGAVRVKGDHVLLRGGAAEDAPVVAWAKRGAVMPVTSRSGAFTRVEWQKDRHAFVATSDVDAAGGTRLSGEITQAWQRQPPRIEIAPDPAKGAPVTSANVFHLKGSAIVPKGVPGAKTKLRDVFVFVNDQKVFFKVVPEDGATTRVDFSADLPLDPGNNTVTVFAREDEEFQSRRTFHVHRRPAAEVAQGRQ